MNPNAAVPLCLPDNHEWDSDNQTLSINTEIPPTKLVVCEDGLSILKEISTPVVVICITGISKSGKSYLLSRIQNGADFPVHHGTSATTGIWITSSSQRITKDGVPARQVYLDTDGLGSLYESSTNKDTTLEKKIFTLCILMSSYLIFNSSSMPSFGDLLQLDPVTSFSDYVSSTSHVSRKRGARVHPPNSPDFLWLVRDESRQPKIQGRNCSWTTFIKSTILQRQDDYRDSQEDRIRKAIICTFGKIFGSSLPSPSSDPRIIRNLDSSLIQPSDLNPAFNRGLQSTASKIRDAAKVKTIAGTPVCGYQLAALFVEAVEALNGEPKVIDVESSWRSILAVRGPSDTASISNPTENRASMSLTVCTEQELSSCEPNLQTVSELEARKFIQKACTSYQTKMLELQLPCPSAEFEDKHQSAVTEAESVFSSMFHRADAALGQLTLYQDELRVAVDNERSLLVENNCCMSIETCEKIAEELREEHLTPLTSNIGIRNDYNDLVHAVDRILVQYDKRAVGPKAGYVRSHEEAKMKSVLENSQRRFIERGVRKAKEYYLSSLNNLRLPASEEDMNRTTRNSRTLALKTFDRHIKGIPSDLWDKEYETIEHEIYNISFKRKHENNALLKEKYLQFFVEWEGYVKLHSLKQSDQLRRATDLILNRFREENTGSVANVVYTESEAKYAEMIEHAGSIEQSTTEISAGAVAAVGVVAAMGLAAFGIAKLFSGDKEKEEEQRRREKQRRPQSTRRY